MSAGESSHKPSFVSRHLVLTVKWKKKYESSKERQRETDPNCNPQSDSISSFTLNMFLPTSSLLLKISKSKATTENSPSNLKTVVPLGCSMPQATFDRK